MKFTRTNLSYYYIRYTSNSSHQRFNAIHISLGHWLLVLPFFNILSPKLFTTSDGVTLLYQRVFSVRIFDKKLILSYGSEDDYHGLQHREFRIPWVHERLNKVVYYDLDGTVFWSGERRQFFNNEDFIEAKEIEEKYTPTQSFRCRDYDGTLVVAETRMTELRYLKGIGYFKWLSWFIKPRIIRQLDIRFSQEIGPGKISWKGGMTRTQLVIDDFETHKMAFIRFCSLEHRELGKRTFRIEYLGPVKIDIVHYFPNRLRVVK